MHGPMVGDKRINGQFLGVSAADSGNADQPRAIIGAMGHWAGERVMESVTRFIAFGRIGATADAAMGTEVGFSFTALRAEAADCTASGLWRRVAS